MKATMTDVQKAIEQLGRSHGTSPVSGDYDARSFSFASTKTGGEDLTEDTDFDMETDGDRDDGEWVGDGDHKDARMKLAEKARKVVEKQRRKEEEEERAIKRSIAPPIEVELSDESDGEDDDERAGVNEITPMPSTMSKSAPSAVGLPTPPSSSIGGQQHTSKHSSLSSEKEVPKEKEVKKTHPIEWSVEDVVDWLRSKGFAEDVTDKFVGLSASYLIPVIG